MKKKLLIITEAALENPNVYPLSAEDQARINGVYRTYENLVPHLLEKYDFAFLTPFDYPGPEQSRLKAFFKKNTPFPAPGQSTIRLVFPSQKDIQDRLEAFQPDVIHITTEGPLGVMAMRCAQRYNIPVSTAFHTNWQQYVLEKGFQIPLLPNRIAAAGIKRLMTIFHNKACGIMTATKDLQDELAAWGIDRRKMHIVSRGVDTAIFRPYPEDMNTVKEPYILYVGRIAPGKGVERFCELDSHGLKKVVVGTGPLGEKLKTQYPEADFVGFASGEKLGKYYSGAVAFVLPSDTETFGMTVIEALACGTPVAALTKGGHQPILKERHGLGIMDSDLQIALDKILLSQEYLLSRSQRSAHITATKSWHAEAQRFSLMLETISNQKIRAIPKGQEMELELSMAS